MKITSIIEDTTGSLYIGKEWRTSSAYQDCYSLCGSEAAVAANNGFSVNDRVWFEETGRVEGTVVRIDDNYIEIKRDDGVEGSGIDGTWCFWRQHAEDGLLYHIDEANISIGEPHIAGLSPETIDKSAYDEFMKGL